MTGKEALPRPEVFQSIPEPVWKTLSGLFIHQRFQDGEIIIPQGGANWEERFLGREPTEPNYPKDDTFDYLELADGGRVFG